MVLDSASIQALAMALQVLSAALTLSSGRATQWSGLHRRICLCHKEHLNEEDTVRLHHPGPQQLHSGSGAGNYLSTLQKTRMKWSKRQLLKPLAKPRRQRTRCSSALMTLETSDVGLWTRITPLTAHNFDVYLLAEWCMYCRTMLKLWRLLAP